MYRSTFVPGTAANGYAEEMIRHITKQENIEMTIGHYLENMARLTTQWTPKSFRDPKRQRLYMKDIDCPQQWRDHLKSILPDFLYYMSENMGEKGGPGHTTYKDKVGHTVKSQGIAPAGDLMSNLPPELRAENLQCYIGHEGTYTPAHKEMCGTTSQNIMVETSSNLKGEKNGSSVWFMTEAQDRDVASEYFISMLGHDIEIENHFAQVVAWKKAPFPVFIAEQKVGDLVLVPPLAPHQVWNRGTRTMKVAWNRTTVDTLEFAMRESLPRARMVCRDEGYKVKATIYYSLKNYYGRLREADKQDEMHEGEVDYAKVWDSYRVIILKDDFCRLAKLLSDIMVNEMFSPDLPTEKNVEYLPFEGNVTCSYCRCNIFNRFLTCKSCVQELANGDEDTYDVCMDCYAMGRSCACISGLDWVEQWKWPELTKRYSEWRDLVVFITGDVHSHIYPLEETRQMRGVKGTAEICQEQLLRRPKHDVKRPHSPDESEKEHEGDSDDDRFTKKVKKNKRGKTEVLSTKPCHICRHPEKPWKLAECTTCENAYCYGSLFRAFDLKPEDIMGNPHWSCPECLDQCGCAKCRTQYPDREPYEPKGSFLGHDTKKVADPRSVESLVDFSRSNQSWLRDTESNPRKTKRMKKFIEHALEEKKRYYAYTAEQLGHQPRKSPVFEGDGSVKYPPGSAFPPEQRHGYPVSDTQDPNALVAPMAPMATTQAPYTAEGYPAGLGAASYDAFAENNQDNGFQSVNGNAQFVSPSDLMSVPGRHAYLDALTHGLPDPQAQVPNSQDDIIFSDPDAPLAPTGENTAYPKLHDVDGNLGYHQKTRKRQSMLAATEMNEAHREYIVTEQREKLVAARKRGRYFMTQGRLLGGHSLIVKLRVPNKRAELEAILAMDRGRAGVRHNPHPARASVSKRHNVGDVDVDVEMEDGDSVNVVTSDMRPGETHTPAYSTSHGHDPFADRTQQSADGRKSNKGRPRKRLLSLEPESQYYKPSSAKSNKRKSRRGEDEDEVVDDPFEHGLDSDFDAPTPPRRKSRSTDGRRKSGRVGRPPKRVAQNQTISGDAQNDMEDDPMDVNMSMHFPVAATTDHRRRSAPQATDLSSKVSPREERRARAAEKKVASAKEKKDKPTLQPTRSSCLTIEPEYVHTMLPRRENLKSTTTSVPSQSPQHFDRTGPDAFDHSDSSSSDDDMGVSRGGSMKPPPPGRRVVDPADQDMFDDGEAFTIPTAESDIDMGDYADPISPAGKYVQSADATPVPKSSARKKSKSASKSTEKKVKTKAQKGEVWGKSHLESSNAAELDHTPVATETWASKYSPSVVGGRERQPSIASSEGYRMADIPPTSTSSAAPRNIPPVPPFDRGYSVGSVASVSQSEAESENMLAGEVPSSQQELEDEDMKVKMAALEKLEEEQRATVAAQEETRRMTIEAAEKAKMLAEETARRVRGESVRRLREIEEQREAMRRKAEAREAAKRGANEEAVAEAAADTQTTVSVPDSPPNRHRSTQMTIAASTTTTVTKKQSMMSMAERRAAAGKSGTFKVMSKTSTPSAVSGGSRSLRPRAVMSPRVEVPTLTLEQRARYSLTTTDTTTLATSSAKSSRNVGGKTTSRMGNDGADDEESESEAWRRKSPPLKVRNRPTNRWDGKARPQVESNEEESSDDSDSDEEIPAKIVVKPESGDGRMGLYVRRGGRESQGTRRRASGRR